MKLNTTNIFIFLFILVMNKSVLADVDNTYLEKLRPVQVQLKWLHQYQFAGFYAAIEQGYFQQAGLDVTLIEGGPTIDPVSTVLNGDAEFGIGNSSLLIDYNKGHPIMVVSAIFQHSPFIILARRDDNIRSVHDLENHTLMVETHAAELITYLKLAGVNLDKIEFVPHTGNVASLAKGDPSNIAALTAFSSSEPYIASQLNIPYQIFSPRELNINFYADALFTSQKFANHSPDTVIAMRDALNKGWEYASTHQDEIISLILNKYHTQPQLDRVALTAEAQAIINLLEKDVVDIGYMSYFRWENIAKLFAKTGALPPDYTLDGFIFEIEDTIPPWVYKILFGALFLIVVGFIITIYIVRLNKKLASSLVKVAEQTNSLEKANQKLSDLSNTDFLTGLANRRRFDEVISTELSRAKRNQQPLALLMIDVDYFKKYNDHYGHQAGDHCLIELATVLKNSTCRASDLSARYGGEEFAIIISNTNTENSIEFANKVCRNVAELAIPHIESSYSIVTVSIGVFSCIPEKEMSIEDFINKADINLYKAKDRGRNKVN